MGRPSEFSQEIADQICARLISPESLRSICRDEDMPGMTTIMRWLNEKEDFRKQYAQAREIQADVIADETQEIVDDASNDWMENNKPDDPGWRENGEAIQRSRLRFDQRRWYLGKLFPKKYGDKIHQELTGADGGPIKSEVGPVSPEQMKQFAAMMVEANKELG